MLHRLNQLYAVNLNGEANNAEASEKNIRSLISNFSIGLKKKSALLSLGKKSHEPGLAKSQNGALSGKSGDPLQGLNFPGVCSSINASRI